MRRIVLLGLLATGFTLYSCGNNQSSEKGESYAGGYVSNAIRTPTTLDGKPIPKETSSATSAGTDSTSGASGGIDIDAKSDSKGVGPYADQTIDVGSSIDAAMAAKGKKLFQNTCTACHTLTKQRLVGPGLKGITKIRTPEWIMNMIDNPINMTKNDPVAKAVKKSVNGVQMTNMGVSKEGIREILEFLRQNDQ